MAFFGHTRQKGRRLDVGRVGDGNAVGLTEQDSQKGAIKCAQDLLAHNVAVIGEDKPAAAPHEQCAPNFAGRIGQVGMGNVNALFHLPQTRERSQADGGGGDVELPCCFDHGHAIDRRLDGVWAGVGDQDAGIDTLGALRLGESADVIFDTAHNRGVVFVDMQYTHCAIMAEKP